jgi:hypothetical protein
LWWLTDWFFRGNVKHTSGQARFSQSIFK